MAKELKALKEREAVQAQIRELKKEIGQIEKDTKEDPGYTNRYEEKYSNFATPDQITQLKILNDLEATLYQKRQSIEATYQHTEYEVVWRDGEKDLDSEIVIDNHDLYKFFRPIESDLYKLESNACSQARGIIKDVIKKYNENQLKIREELGYSVKKQQVKDLEARIPDLKLQMIKEAGLESIFTKIQNRIKELKYIFDSFEISYKDGEPELTITIGNEVIVDDWDDLSLDDECGSAHLACGEKYAENFSEKLDDDIAEIFDDEEFNNIDYEYDNFDSNEDDIYVHAWDYPATYWDPGDAGFELDKELVVYVDIIIGFRQR